MKNPQSMKFLKKSNNAFWKLERSKEIEWSQKLAYEDQC